MKVALILVVLGLSSAVPRKHHLFLANISAVVYQRHLLESRRQSELSREIRWQCSRQSCRRQQVDDRREDQLGGLELGL